MKSASIEALEKRVADIELRNQRVERDKAWEASGTRKVAVAITTYIVVWLYLRFVVHIDPWINAIVPTAGFLISTLTLTFIKSLWLENRAVDNDDKANKNARKK